MSGNEGRGRIEGRQGRGRRGGGPRSRRMIFALLALVCIVSAAVASAALAAQGEPGQEEGRPFALTPKMIEEANQAHAGGSPPLEVDTKAAHELPHTGLDQGQALDLLTSVFPEATESPAGIFDELPEGKFLGTDAELLPPESVAELAEESGSGRKGQEAEGPAIIESATPLRVEDEKGALKPVDLSLEHTEGELQPQNPIVPVGIPTELGEGVELGKGGVGISFPGAAAGREATVVEGDSAFYANVQEDTDLLVAPTPTGVETMTQIRSAEAPRTQVVELSVPAGASLLASEDGGAEVKSEGKQLLEVTPATAVDAAGEPVPTTISVSGDQLRITVEPEAGTSFPILVDPNYRNDEYNWVWGGSGFAGWTSVDSASGYQALPYSQGYNALGLYSWGYWGGATPNTGAQWAYLVPRYSSDLATYGTLPTSWIEEVRINGLMYLQDSPATTYPEIVSGIINTVEGGWVNNWIWDGAWGEISGWKGEFALANPGHLRGAKEFVFGLITLENEAAARSREAEAATAVVELRDNDTPVFKSLGSPPGGWVSGGEYALPYEVEDTGLGVAGVAVEVEGQSSTDHMFALGCNGTNQSPCPRVAKSTEAGRPAIKLNAAEAPTGRDYFKVGVYDALFGWVSGAPDTAPHIADKTVELKVDHTPPVVSLSGPLTEQETIGTTLPEYPLNIAVTDGEDGAPQSGVASVEVKVDGKKVTMPNETPWHPACTTQNCSFTGTWTLKASEYALGNHEVEVIAKDAVGLETTEVQEVELGQEPLQTSFTSPHPTYEAHEIPTISFKGTREGKPVEGVTFKCSLDEGETPTKPCSTPFNVPANLKPGKWHTLRVAAVEKGVADPTPATWTFETGAYPTVPANSPEKLVYPEVGKKTASYYTLEAEWGANPEGKAAEGVTGVSFEMKLPKAPGATEEPVFEPVPTGCVIDGHGKPVSWPLRPRSHPGHTQPVYLRVKGCPVFEKAGYPEKEIQFRAVFDGSAQVAGASEPNATEFVYVHNGTRVPTDATEAVGPAAVNLLTGAFSISHTDVSIPVPGYETNLEFTRTYNSSRQNPSPGYKAFGGLWQPSSPLESEYEGEAWTRIEEKIIPKKEVVYGYACWSEVEEEFVEVECVNPQTNCPEATCEKWVSEPAQPEEKWIELFDTEGNGIPFEIVNENTYVAPEYARELKLTREGDNFVLGYPNGTQTTFARDGEGAHDWLPELISFQASSKSMRLNYKPEGKSLRLVSEIAPAPVPCGVNESIAQVGCRTLKFEYGTPFGGGPLLLTSIKYYGPSGSEAAAEVVAQYTYQALPGEGLPEYVLGSESDPRLPSMSETYAYSGSPLYLLTSITPYGQEPWTFGYEYGSSTKPSRLKTVTRAGATTTIAYGVPVSGSGAPYAMSPESVATWGQTDIPVDATAVFPPTHVPAEYPPHEYTGATVHYMDPEGHQVNVASPSPPGVTGASIATTETNVHGNVIRELDPQNRLNALEASNTVARSHELDTHSVYNAAGTEQLESWGPLHKVRLKGGEVVEARQHTVTRYDEGEPTPPAGTPWAFLPTREFSSVVVAGGEGELERKITESWYDWELRKPVETTIDPGGLDIRSITRYNGAGQVIETRQPKNAEAAGAGTTQTTYYTAGTGGGECESSQYANLPCKVLPAAQVSGTGRPKLLVKKFTAYDNLDEPTVVKESAGGEGEERVTTTTYDKAGRPTATKVAGGGLEVPKTETEYSPTLGTVTGQHLACDEECSAHVRYSSSFGSSGAGNGQFSDPGDVALDRKGDLWVADRFNDRLEEFNEKGEFLKTVGSVGSGNGQFKSPKSIAFTAAGNFWVADAENNRLQEFNEKGEFIKAVGSAGSGNGQFNRPEHLAIDAKGNIWVSDTYNYRIQELNENGEFIKVVKPSGLGEIEPTGIAVGPGGNVWVTDWSHNRVVEINEAGTSVVRQFGTEGTGNGQFRHPDAVTVDHSGDVWVVDQENERVEEFNQEGKYLGQFGTPGVAAGQFSLGYPTGIATDAKGDIWVTDPNDNRIEKWTTPAAFNSQATTTEYNKLGEVTRYKDADGNEAETTYDAYGRPVTVKDNKGSRTVTYDPATGLPTQLEVSGVGTFTARYDANGDLVETTMPNGIAAKRSYNAAGEPMSLAYTKTSSCGESCTWFEETLERGAEGRILSDSNSLASDRYSYDNAGRLTESSETPIGGNCTTRAYTYDADSNRLSKTTRTGVGGACATSGGTPQNYEYDEGDRLMGTGITYDAFGRIEKLPAADAGGSELVTKYFSTNTVAIQSQGGVTNSFQLDAAGRQRQREQAGGVAGTEIFHYDNGSDSPSWTALGSTWSRNITGFGGELTAIQESSGTTTFKLTDLHGDVVASASSSPTETKLLATYRFSEFGEPVSGATGRFGWLGGKQRRTELSSGVVQMGARSYIPQLGRFLTPDPVPRGSANAYDYADQDPVNSFDLTGTQTHDGGGHPKHTLLKTHSVKAIAEGGVVRAVFGFTAGASVTVRAHVSFRGITGPIHGVTSKGTTLPMATKYSGPASTGEIATVCVHAFTSSQSETHCYNTPVKANEPKPQPEPEPEIIPIPIEEGVEDVVGALA